ncbi:MAG: NDP-sugar synthase [Candidatus Margulisbacteria bacterium]|nr:NDP-sugar synthase [Candidatus Margulisiibacteriota bacterium]
MKAVIIAGGLGTRLRPLTYNTPKPIVPVVNRPFVVHQIEHLVKHGVDEVILNLHYLSHEIKKILDDGKQWGIKIHYSIEEHPLGTAGAVKNAEQFFDEGPMVVFNGDVLTDINISKVVSFHREKGATVTLTLTEVEDPTPFGLVLTDKNGRVTQFLEKPSWSMVTAKTINAGIYVVDPKIFKLAPVGKPYSFERELYPTLLEQGAPIFGYPSQAYWIDIGNPQKYIEAHQAILRGEVAVKIIGTRINGKFWLGKDTHPDASVRFAGASVVGEKVKLGNGTEIGDYVVLGNNVSVGAHCRLERAIVWQDTKIGDHVHLSDCILGNKCLIEDNVVIERGVVLADGSVVKKGTRLTS